MTEQGESRSQGEVTGWLLALRAGDRDALDQLFPLVYGELRRAAERLLHGERPGHTLQPTALVHEAYLKMCGQVELDLQNRAHFFGVAARAMRQILVDHARRRKAAKRGGGVEPTVLSDEHMGLDIPMDELLSLDDALDRLDRLSPRLRQVVEYRFFGGLTEDEVAEVLGVTPRTARRDWAKARAWLHKELYPQENEA